MPNGEVSDPITVVFPGKGGTTGICKLPHEAGKTVKRYFVDPPLRPFGLIAAFLGRGARGQLYNGRGERIRLLHVPEPGDVIVLR